MHDMNVSNYSDVINWVAKMHDQQYRKGTQIPYMAHVFGVAFSLISAGIDDRDVIIGALTHDVVEDSEATIDSVRELYGETVASYVGWLSEDKEKSWEERKLVAIRHIDHMPLGAKWIKLADKLNSLEMMSFEVKNGTMNWDKFNKGYLFQKWYYTRILYELGQDGFIESSALYHHAISLIQTVFGDVYGVVPATELGVNGEDERTIYVGEGITKSGWNYACEFWTVDQVSSFTYYFDRNIVNDLEKENLVKFLGDEELVDFYGDKKYVAASEIVDQKGQLIISVNVVVGDDEELYSNPKALVSWKFK